ncbi:MAG: hypothetical protein GFH24_608346n26 [Chloroflexi bacterium AL-N5]|nr:hypothetical protein [Chloroflexi bacterium AL-N5]
MISSIAKNLFIGAFLSIFIAIVTIACILAYGVANAPWDFYLSLQEVDILVFIVNADGAFEFRVGAGTLQALMGLTLFCALISFIIEHLVRHKAKKITVHA